MLDKQDKKIIKLGNLEIGNGKPVFIAGPCSIESEDHIMEEAINLKKIGLDILRGGAFKPRTSPYDFQGLGFEGIKYLRNAADAISVPMVTEVLSEFDIDRMYDYVDIFQVGSRNMYNYALLKELGKQDRPVLLKRGFSASLDEWMKAAEYIISGGNDKVIYCERGIRTFNDYTRNTLDLAGAVLVKQLTSRPVIIDPSHATGRRSLIEPMTDAGLACGLDGVIIEVNKEPDKSISDSEQTIDYETYRKIREKYEE
jgi:3-deoxy-7-phosphoheptulonate synthase